MRSKSKRLMTALMAVVMLLSVMTPISAFAADVTMDLGKAMIRTQGDQVLLGVGAGVLPVGFMSGALEATIRSPYWGSRPELIEVLDLARSSGINVHTEVYSLDDAPKAYEKLKNNEIIGRAVIVP